MTLTAAARTSAQSAAFDSVSIVPSIRTACTTLPATMTIASSVCAMRQVRGRRSPAKCRQQRDGEDRPHRDHAERRERRRRSEQQRVDHVGRTGEPEAADVDHDGRDQRAADPQMHAPPETARQPRQVSADQQRLNQQDAERDNAGEACQDVDRTAPFEQRARRGGGERHADGGSQGDPDQDRPDRSASVRLQRDQAGCRTKCASRLVSFGLRITGRRNTVLNSPLS